MDIAPPPLAGGGWGEGAHQPRPLADGRLRLRRRPAPAAVRLHLPPVAVGRRRLPRADRPDREYRPRLLAEVPLGARARQRRAPRPAAAPRPPPRLAGRDPALARRRRRCAGAVGPRAPAVPRPGAGRPRRLPLRQPGHRGGRLAHRGLPPASPGRGHGGLHLGLSRRAADRDHRRDLRRQRGRLACGAARRRGTDRPRAGRDPAGAGTAAGGAPRRGGRLRCPPRACGDRAAAQPPATGGACARHLGADCRAGQDRDQARAGDGTP